MRVVVTGASGNVGTAVLRTLHEAPEVEQIVGISRRLPDVKVEPYRGVEWQQIDIGGATEQEAVVATLTDAFRNADTVIHLAWLIQPNRDRDLLRRVNVDGTKSVVRAAAQAQVPHLVVASSVGSYTPDEARAAAAGDPGENSPLRAEDFPTKGIQSSHYSTDKAAVEDILDEFEAAHPEVAVTRLRPALIFQRDAASEIQRYFLGSAVPTQLLREKIPGGLPLPKGLRVQAVHAADVAQAYVAAAVQKVPGAFNICADDVLGPQQLADTIDSGRFFEIPASLVRGALAGAWRTGAVPTDPGWLDMALQVPLLDNSRAKRDLGWAPTRTAASALRELLDGMAEKVGHDSPPLHPAGDEQKVVAAFDTPVSEAAELTQVHAPDEDALQAKGIDTELLNLYLTDHLTGAAGGVDRIERMARVYVDTDKFADIERLAREIRADQQYLSAIVDKLGFAQKPHRQAAAWLGEKAARLKSNGRFTERSPMKMVLHTELMRSAVAGKLGGWETLREYAEDLGLDPAAFDVLIASAHEQLRTLAEIHDYATERAFLTDRETFGPQNNE